MRMSRISLALGALALVGCASPREVLVVDEWPEPQKARPEPKMARKALTPADEERMRAAEMKRARKAAKRQRDAARSGAPQ